MESWWENKHHENILFIQYEDMLQDLPKEMKRIIQFLGLDDVSEKTFNAVLQDASFGSMQTNPNTNYTHKESFDQSKSKFIRSGRVGEWKEYFTVAHNEWFDDKYGKRWQQNGLRLKFE